MILHLCKILLMAATALFFTLVVFNNLTDYDSNYQFVQHVLTMDTIFSKTVAAWRAIENPLFHHLFYIGIILWEAMVAVLCWIGTLQCWKAIRRGEADFRSAQKTALIGMVVGLLLWFVAFITIGGEWFLMWQSDTWNGQTAAFRMFTIQGIILLFCILPNTN